MSWANLIQQILASALFVAVVPAVIAAVVAILIVQWQLHDAEQAALSTARIVYGEISFNLAVITETLKSTRPPLFWVADDAWRTHQAVLASVLDEAKLAMVQAPYVMISAHRQFFSQIGLELLIPRLTGEDRKLLEQLHASFVGAEMTLRPKAWSGRRRKALTKWVTAQPPLTVVRSRRAAMTGLFSIRSGLGLLVVLGLWWMLDRIARALEAFSNEDAA